MHSRFRAVMTQEMFGKLSEAPHLRGTAAVIPNLPWTQDNANIAPS